MSVWPAPIVRLFLGQLTPAAVLAAADNPDPAKQKGQICEANFYSGALALRQGAKDEVTRLFRLAANDCPRGFIEWLAARSELKALGVTPRSTRTARDGGAAAFDSRTDDGSDA